MTPSLTPIQLFMVFITITSCENLMELPSDCQRGNSYEFHETIQKEPTIYPSILPTEIMEAASAIGQEQGKATGCPEPPCKSLVAEIKSYYGPIANRSGKEILKCVKCCQNGRTIFVLVLVLPNTTVASGISD